MKWNRPQTRQTKASLCTAIALLLAGPMHGQAATSESDLDATNAATNPTTPKLTLQAWDNWSPRANGGNGRGGNALLSRNIIPVETFGVMNLVHVELPVLTNPTVPGGSKTGLGGAILYNFSIVKRGSTTYGAGPLVVLPTETSTHFGAQKWQAGVAGVVLDAPKWGLLGGIFTYQHAFGRGQGPITQTANLQTLIHYNLRRGTYLQSEGTTVITSGAGVRAVPIGLGIGKVWARPSGGTVSAFVEPQYSVWRRGAQAPGWQLFSGISVQIPRFFKLWSR